MGKGMLTFKEYFTESVEVDEAMNASQRLKAKATFRKNKAKIMMGRKKAEKRIANPEKLMKRAMKAARKAFEKKLLKDKSKDDLNFAGRQALEKRLESKKAAIAKLAKKLLPAIKKAEMEKHQSKGGK